MDQEKLVVYCRKNCKMCDVVKQKLNDKNIEYIEKNVDDNVDEVKDSPYMMLPILKQGNKYLSTSEI